MNFTNFYYDKRKQQLNIPIYLELVREVKEDGTILMDIPNDMFPVMVEHGVLKIVENGKDFYDINEALEYRELVAEGKKSKVQTLTAPNVVWKDKRGIERPFEVIGANTKIGTNTIVLNMSTARGCISGVIGLCPLFKGGGGGECYAIAQERQYKDVIAKNKRIAQEWACMTPQGLADGINAIVKANSGIKYVRFNEAGEFRNRPTDPKNVQKAIKYFSTSDKMFDGIDDIKKTKNLAKLCPKLVFYTYTRRSDLNFGGMPTNVVIQGSGWYVHNAFMPIPADDYLEVLELKRNGAKLTKLFGVDVKGPIVKCMGDCSVCKYCKKRGNYFILAPIHGSGSRKQVMLQKWKNTIRKDPKFDAILRSDDSLEVKAKKLMDLFDVSNKRAFSDLVVLGSQRTELFDTLMFNEKAKKDFIDLMSVYSGKQVEMLANSDIPIHDQNKGIELSIDALKGEFKSNVEKAQAEGKSTAENKWKQKIKTLDNIIEKSKKGEKFREPSADLAKRVVKSVTKTMDSLSKNNEKDQTEEISDKFKIKKEQIQDEILLLKNKIADLPKEEKQNKKSLETELKALQHQLKKIATDEKNEKNRKLAQSDWE